MVLDIFQDGKRRIAATSAHPRKGDYRLIEFPDIVGKFSSQRVCKLPVPVGNLIHISCRSIIEIPRKTLVHSPVTYLRKNFFLKFRPVLLHGLVPVSPKSGQHMALLIRRLRFVFSEKCAHSQCG